MGTLVFQATLGGSVNLIGPNTASTINFTLPSADGTSGQALTTNGSGTLSFATVTTGAAGSTTQVQYNSSGAFAGSANLTFNGTTLTAANTSITTSETLSYGTANGVTYLNGSKVLTSGSALTFDGTNLGLNATPTSYGANYRTFALNGVSGSQIDFQVGGTVKNYIYGSSATFQYDSTSIHVWSLSNSEQMRLTSTGLGIGTSSPAAKLHIVSTSLPQLRIEYNSSYYTTISNNGTFNIVDASTGNPYTFQRNGSAQMILDTSGNLGLGVTPSAWVSNFKAFQVGTGGTFYGDYNNTTSYFGNNAYFNGTNWKYVSSSYALYAYQDRSAGKHVWATAASGTAGNNITWTEAMTLDASGNWLLGTTNIGYTRRMGVTGSGDVAMIQTTGGSTALPLELWNTATSGDNRFIFFYTEGTPTTRGSITYNRAGGLTVYGTTSDYRAKDIIGPVINSGELIDSVPVYMGKMKGATQERPMFIAHETPAYAHIGEKDAVDADGNPVYQQMDASSLIPVMWAEIQSLRQRVAQLETN